MIRTGLLFLAFCAAVAFGPVVHAQAAPPAYSGLAALNNIIRNTPGVSFVATGGAATVSASAAEGVTVASTGLTVPVMVNAAAGLSGARLAGLLATGMKLGSIVGAATVILPMISQATGIVVCPPPQFFCKPDPNGPPAQYVAGHYINSTGLGGCLSQADGCGYAAAANAYCGHVYTPYDTSPDPNPAYTTYPSPQYKFYFKCAVSSAIYYVYQPQQTVCPAGYFLSGNQCLVNGTVIPLVDAPASDISNALPTPLNQQSNMQSAVQTAQASNVVMFDVNSPVTVTAPQVTTPAQTKTETVSNPDGTTSTKVTSSTSVITPAVSGSTIGNTTITYPTTTTVTTTTTNNTTNVVTTNTTTFQENATPDAPQKLDLPTDYNREVTQRRIEADLNTDGAPKLPDQTAVVNAAKADSDGKMGQMRTDATNGMPDDENRFWHFLFSPPTGTCAPYTLTVNGHDTGQVDICDWVGKLQTLLAWLMALGTAFGVFKNMVGGASDE